MANFWIVELHAIALAMMWPLELIEAGDRQDACVRQAYFHTVWGQECEDPVIGIIKGSGLIDDIYVVNNELPVMLISNTSLVDKGHLCAG
jgi:hypothetical protein